MTPDRVELALLVLAFAALLTTHVALATGIARRTNGWHGLVAFFVFPMAPWWGWQAKMRVRGVIWMVAAILYAVMLALAYGA